MPSPYGHTIAVIGIAGTEGSALLKYLHFTYPKVKITAHDSSEEKLFLKAFKEAHSALKKEEALEAGREILGYENVEYHFRDAYLNGIEGAETIFVPQSWYLYGENKLLEKFKDRFRSITRIYFDLFPGRIIGVTGSQGKTTTTNLIASIMKRAFPRTLFSGNDRRTDQVLEMIAEAKKEDWLVLEISNRQLKIDLGRSPDIGVITNITPNHLTEHKNFEDYALTKASLIKYQKENQWSVLNGDDPESKKLIEIDSGETMPFSTEEALPKGVFVEFGQIRIKHADKNEVVMDVSDFPLLGKHNLSNALAAIAATYLAGVPIDGIAQTLRSVESIPQRLERIESTDGIEWTNDSAATSPTATMAALETLFTPEKKLILIMGGRSKGLEYEDLAENIIKKAAILILLKSPLTDELKALLKNKHSNMIEVETLSEAVEEARKKARAGDRVVLSPGGEYFVYFKGKMAGYKNFRDLMKRSTSLPPPSPRVADQALKE